MQTYTPDLTEQDHEIRKSIMQRFLSSFKENVGINPHNANETCDLHLKGQQPVLYVTPKKFGTNNINWSEPIDKKLFWLNKIKFFWFALAFFSFFFALFIYYFWGVISA